MTKLYSAAALVLALSVGVLAQDYSLELKHARWTTISSFKDFPLGTVKQSDSLFFDFPVIDKFVAGTNEGSINYLYNIRPPKVILGATALNVSISVQVTGAPTFNYQLEPGNTCVTPATARPFIWANDNDFGEFSRWWSEPTAFTLADGSQTMTIPLTPDRWSSVFGKLGTYDEASLAGFNAALENVSSLGLTFGGGCFFGHGVNVSNGTARFILLDYSVVP